MELTPEIIAVKAAMGRENKALIGNDGVVAAAAATPIRNSGHKAGRANSESKIRIF